MWTLVIIYAAVAMLQDTVHAFLMALTIIVITTAEGLTLTTYILFEFGKKTFFSL